MAVFEEIKKGLEQAIEYEVERQYNAWREKYEMYEAIAEYFEAEENWSRLQRCYLINGEAAEFRRMLREAMGLDGKHEH